PTKEMLLDRGLLAYLVPPPAILCTIKFQSDFECGKFKHSKCRLPGDQTPPCIWYDTITKYKEAFSHEERLIR
ncbi:MAG: hypothetical protein J5963_03215, partial [Schwartzia sp.]|nr:hypothetical protein [Schwartzia sp. (in: firmicutes)]